MQSIDLTWNYIFVAVENQMDTFGPAQMKLNCVLIVVLTKQLHFIPMGTKTSY